MATPFFRSSLAALLGAAVIFLVSPSLRAQSEADATAELGLAKPEDRLRQAITDALTAAQELDNEPYRKSVDSAAAVLQRMERVRAAEAFGAQGAVLYMKRYLDEAWYAYARAADLEPVNAEWANNLASTLLERGDNELAIGVLTPLIELYPNLDMVIGNLAAAQIATGDCRAARANIMKAISLSPGTGLYRYTLGKAMTCEGDNTQKAFDSAWALGFAGSGREGEPPGDGGGKGTPSGGAVAGGKNGGSSSGSSGAQTTNQLNGSVRPGGNSKAPPAPANDGKPIPEEWVGHYEAEYVRGKTERKNVYGRGLASTAVMEDILVCAKEFSMDIDRAGNITGRGRLMYVFLGRAAGAPVAMMPGIGTAMMGGFMATLKDGFQERGWQFTGRVDSKGNVEITGIPTEKLPFLNVGQKQEIMPWSVFPPPAMTPRGPSNMTLANEKGGVPSIHFDRPVTIAKGMTLQYQAYIRKSDAPIACDCKRLEPPKPKCPASEYLKLKSSVGANGKLTVESSYDVGSGKSSSTVKAGAKAGPVSGSIDANGKCQIRGQVGMVTGGAEYNASTGSYQMSIGVGIDSGKLLPGPNKISERVELIYDSNCGWGIKGTMGASTMSMGAEVEGAVFFNKGM